MIPPVVLRNFRRNDLAAYLICFIMGFLMVSILKKLAVNSSRLRWPKGSK